MKLLLGVLVSFFWLASVKAQILYSPGDTVKGKNASYYCVKKNNIIVKIKNTQNKYSWGNMYFENGKIVPPDWAADAAFDFKFEDFMQVFKNALSIDELNQLKGKKGVFQVNVIADKLGNALELEFLFFAKDPVLSKFDPDRLFKLETNLKKLLKLKLSEEDRKIKNINYLLAISFSKDL